MADIPSAFSFISHDSKKQKEMENNRKSVQGSSYAVANRGKERRITLIFALQYFATYRHMLQVASPRNKVSGVTCSYVDGRVVKTLIYSYYNSETNFPSNLGTTIEVLPA
jgi:hypothetical protein